MKWLLLLLMTSGCSLVKELKKPPFPYSVTHHVRVVGIEATVPNQAGDAVFKLRLGFFSDVTILLPCSTNEIHMPAYSDRFRLGQSGLDTSITEELNTGWRDLPPPPMMRLFTHGEPRSPPPRIQADPIVMPIRHYRAPKDSIGNPPMHALSSTNTDSIMPPTPPGFFSK